MVQTVEATYDGAVFRPAEPVSLAPNTRVRITVESEGGAPGEPQSFLDTARSLGLEGPGDWSVNLRRIAFRSSSCATAESPKH
jgi:predicted DNA-binding antitoxin AbrB/MazE fold protein